jgi:hypothetical protein
VKPRSIRFLSSIAIGFSTQNLLAPERISAEFCPSDFEMPAQRFLRAFDVTVSTIVIFELALDQKVRLVAVPVVPKTDLEVFTARTGHRNARKGEFRHAHRQYGLYPRAGSWATRSLGTGPGTDLGTFRKRPTTGQIPFKRRSGQKCRRDRTARGDIPSTAAEAEPDPLWSGVGLVGSSGGARDGGWAKWGLRSLSPELPRRLGEMGVA